MAINKKARKLVRVALGDGTSVLRQLGPIRPTPTSIVAPAVCPETPLVESESLFTLEDLERAESDAAYGDCGKHSNPGRSRRHRIQAAERVTRIRRQLTMRGVLKK